MVPARSSSTNSSPPRRAAESAQVSRFLGDMVGGVGPHVAQGRDTKLLRAILEDTDKRIGKELAIPVYLYEAAATEEKRRNLANNRAGEYEGLKKKLVDPAWKPDFGPDKAALMLTARPPAWTDQPVPDLSGLSRRGAPVTYLWVVLIDVLTIRLILKP